jgi:ADP-ribose pyrophosphatase
MSSRFEELSSATVYQGTFLSVRRSRFRFEDGEEADREIVGHPGAVGIVVHDGRTLFLVRQPREAIGLPDLLEIPAGKLDEEGETPLETAKRELGEEIGKAADHWEHLVSFFVSPGFSDEEIHIFLATGLRDVPDELHDDERIHVETYPLAELDRAIADSRDSKTLVGLLELRRRLHP